MRRLCSFWEALLDTFFPPRCPLCRAYTPRRGDWCAGCLRGVVAERRLGVAAEPRGLDAAYALCRYHGGMRKLIRAVKYQRKFAHLPALHSLLNQTRLLERVAFDCAVPVPLHASRMRERGFNQTEKIFHTWAVQRGITWLDALERIQKTKPQYGLHRRERQNNLRGAFCVKPEMAIKGQRILLLDDILTTGATLEECCRTLKAAGAETVIALVLASDA